MQIPKLSLWICALALGGALTIHAEDTAAQAAARKALIDALNNPPAADTASPAAPAAPAAPVAPAPVASTPPPAAIAPAPADPPAVPVEPQPGDSEAQAKARAALMQQMGTAAPAPAAANVPATSAAAATPAKSTVPPTPVLSSKEQKLKDLLARYKADKLTPLEYHEQRAAILAAP